MKSILGLFSICLVLPPAGNAQSETVMLVQPYLQDAEPHSIKILWETSSGEESIVEWGPTPQLGEATQGTDRAMNFSAARLHEVKLTGLKRFTEYYYRVKTEDLRSDIFQFKTPPFSNDRSSFNIVAMSDMQYDAQNPDKFSEIVSEGVLPFIRSEYGGNIPENLAMVLVPGDLVENGAIYHQWKDHFFKPAHQLFAEVPVYPVLGNHERNSQFYFEYFSLPQNGTPAYAEHWWYKDYGNTRIIGLNSNDGYRDIRLQKEWLENLLAKTAQEEGIEFVFAQLHHPHKSELWIPGEEDFAGEVVKLLEKFSTETGKPSIHFFGHTHGYSRGQSRDHKHLWINVATAGGAIDNWGEFEGRDYAEFSVTQDEYGFVMVEVDGSSDDPKFTIKRISRGNEDQFRENELRDSITVWRKEKKPMTPEPVAPKHKAVEHVGVMLKAGLFASSFKAAFHAASHWQVSASPDFEKLVSESWKQHENWYYEEDRQKNDDLTDEKLTRLQVGTTYYWRVRYRDQNLNWSDWSEAAKFSTLP